MKRFATVAAVATGLVLWGATPAEAQLWFFPNYASPSAYGTPTTWVAANYGRGLNDTSGQLNAFGAAVGRTGIGGRATISVGGGYVDDPLASEVTLGGGVAVDLLPEDAEARLSVQTGLGWIAPDAGGVTLTSLYFPIGVALSTTIENGTSSIRPWVMPRLQVTRISSAGVSASETDFGASAGVSFTTAGGFGLHAAVDLLAANSSLWQGGAGIHYMIH